MPRNLNATTKPSYRHLRSLNVDRDRGNGELMDRYVITPNAIRALSRFADALLHVPAHFIQHPPFQVLFLVPAGDNDGNIKPRFFSCHN